MMHYRRTSAWEWATCSKMPAGCAPVRKPLRPMSSGNDNHANHSGGTMKSTLFVGLSLLFVSFGCGGGLRVDSVATSSDKPSNVAVYLTVTKDGQPVKELFEKNFKVSE